MSIACGVPLLEVAYILCCGRYLCKRWLFSGQKDSKGWSLAVIEDFEPVPRMCRMVLAVYEADLDNPKWPPEGGYRIDSSSIVKRGGYEDTHGRCPPYLIYVDHTTQDIVLAVRGLNLTREKDYSVLLNNELGKERFGSGYVHHGLLKAAKWLLHEEADTLSQLVTDHFSYKLSLTGHSLGSGVVSLLTLLILEEPAKVGNIARERIRCFAIAPARCMSLNLALLHADVIHSVILQDDFLPRTVTPLEDIFKSIFCLPCLLCSRCTKDTFMVESLVLKDPRRLYTPGRVYHIVDKQSCRCGRVPPVVKTAVPVEGRFEHVILSCDATKDHSIVWIEKESQRALEHMTTIPTEVPPIQKMTRTETMQEEHKAALQKAQTLKVPNI